MLFATVASALFASKLSESMFDPEKGETASDDEDHDDDFDERDAENDDVPNEINHNVDFRHDGDDPQPRGRIRRRFSSASASFVSTDSIETYIPHYRLAPILSGVVIPFSILLEIPGLTDDWYIRTGEANKIVDKRPNTAILEAGTAISFGCAVVANIFLIMRFLEYKVLITTVACIVFLTIHGMLLLLTKGFARLDYITRRYRYHQHYNGHCIWRRT
jgi:potassium channel subfamily K, other eukaryote